jgi:uncharacterized membrane protein
MREVTENEVMLANHQAMVRRTAVRGAFAGFLFGLIPLMASIGMGAMAGAVIAKASQVRIDRGRPPSIHFAGAPAEPADARRPAA